MSSATIWSAYNNHIRLPQCPTQLQLPWQFVQNFEYADYFCDQGAAQCTVTPAAAIMVRSVIVSHALASSTLTLRASSPATTPWRYRI
mmetsp:Transcript_45982/g.82796  ORF Transcript_45982/g.82796 Transcript_45982/m.82796 type:complete len:88 (-) Transcript_45982:420-683(-)